MHKLGVLCLPLLIGCSLMKPIVGISQEDQEKLDGYLSRGIAYYDTGKYAQAEQQFRKAYEIDDSNIDANLGVARSLLYQNSMPKFDEAEKILERARSLADDDFRIYYSLGSVHYARARLCQFQLDAWKAQRPISESGRDPVADTTALRNRSMDEATSNYRKTLELNKDYVYALSGLGQIAALRGDRDGALQLFYAYLEKAEATHRFFEETKVRVNDPDSLDIVERKLERNEKKEAEVRILVANLLFGKGDYEGAITQLNRVLEIQPDSSREYLNRGQCYAKIGDYRQAAIDVETFLRKANKIGDPALEEAHRLLGEYRSKASDADAAKGEK